MSWNVGYNRNLFLKLKIMLGIHHVVLTTPETAPEKHTLSMVEIDKLPNNDRTDSEEEIFSPKMDK